MRFHLHSKECLHQNKTQKITSIGKDVEKLEPSYVAGRNVKWFNHCGKEPGNSSKS